MESTKLGQLSAKMMTDIENLMGDHDGMELGVVGIVAEIKVPANPEYPHGATRIVYQCSDERAWISEAIFMQAQRVVIAQSGGFGG